MNGPDIRLGSVFCRCERGDADVFVLENDPALRRGRGYAPGRMECLSCRECAEVGIVWSTLDAPYVVVGGREIPIEAATAQRGRR